MSGKEEDRLSDRQLRDVCKACLKVMDKSTPGYEFLSQLMLRFIELTKYERFHSGETSELVDELISRGGLKKMEIYREIAERTGKTPEAVRVGYSNWIKDRKKEP